MTESFDRPETLVDFLCLEAGDFALLSQYQPLFDQDADQMARDFYQYLFSHSATAATFRDYSDAQIETLIQQQAKHGSGLLRGQLAPSWQAAMHTLGAHHHRLDVDPSWIAGAYIVYWRHWQAVVQKQVPESDRERLNQILFSMLMGDLMSQLRGYARASRETDSERIALFDVLLDTLAGSRGEHTTENAGLLQILCEALPRKSRQITLAGYLITPSGSRDTLRLEAVAGVPLNPLPALARSSNDPCWMALSEGQVVTQVTDDPQCPEWIRKLRPSVQEMAFFPFGTGDLRGVGFIGSREKHYFSRIGARHFEAFAHLGEIVLQLRNRLLRDPLTHLPNRLLFMDRLEIARRQSLREESLLGVAMLDLDGFKPVNDRFGHASGDRLLLALTQRIRNCLRSGDTLGRIGGDEFGLLFPALESVDDLDNLGARILEAIRKPVEIEGESVSVTGSLGITLYPLDDVSAETLLSHADLALYAAKSEGGDRSSLYSLTLNEAAQSAANMRHTLERALKNGSLVLHYQPIVNSSGAVRGVESLIRIADPVRGLLTPAAFWAALDHHRYARKLGLFVMDSAFRQGQEWCQQGLDLRVSVNISAHHLLDARFLEDLQNALQKYPDLPPEQIEIEITESAPLRDMEHAQARLMACNALGVGIALDDFGTGNASLTYLQRLPAQSIKLDQGFVRDMINDPKDLAIVAAVITAGRMLGLDVIAEGVETEAHAKLLTKMGCGYLQGYLLAKPMPASDLSSWLSNFRGLGLGFDQRASIDILPALLEGHAQRVESFLIAMRELKTMPQHVLELGAEEKCHLGCWLKGDGAQRFGMLPEFARIQEHHGNLHHLARKAKQLLDAENVPGALYQGSLLEKENERMIEKIRELTQTTGDSSVLRCCTQE